jgi:hypothetical protein
VTAPLATPAATQAAPGTPMIAIDNVSKWYGDFQVPGCRRR